MLHKKSVGALVKGLHITDLLCSKVCLATSFVLCLSFLAQATEKTKSSQEIETSTEDTNLDTKDLSPTPPPHPNRSELAPKDQLDLFDLKRLKEIPELPITLISEFTKTFFFLPNTVSLRPFAFKTMSTSGTVSPAEQSLENNNDGGEFSFLSFLSISHVLPPKQFNTWLLKFSPSINFYSWKDPGDIKFVHLTYNAKLLWNFIDEWGTFKLALGIGPMWLDGKVFGQEEKDKFTAAPRFQIGYYKFVTSRIIVQLKYTKHYIIERVFDGSQFEVNNFSNLGLHIGYYFGSL